MADCTDFLDKYQLQELQELYEKKEAGDKAAAKELRQCLQVLEREEAGNLKDYLQQPKENPQWEEKRKNAAKFQKQSVALFVVCLALTLVVAVLLITKSNLLYIKWLDGIVLAIAIALVIGVWVSDDRSAKNRSELLLAQILQQAQQQAQQAAALEDTDAADAAPEDPDAADAAPEDPDAADAAPKGEAQPE